MESQCLGLAAAVGVTPEVKRLRLRAPWTFLTPYVRFGGTLQFHRGTDEFRPPWPDLLIATGRQSVAAALLVKRRSRGKTLTVQIQKPAAGLSRFDLVIAPEHDGIEGANVLSTRGALHRITPELLSRNAQALAPRLAGLQRPLIAVLLGGSNAVYRLEAEEMPILAEQLASAARRTGGSLAVTPSRRTGADVLHILSERLQGVPHFIWDGQGENPYFGLLGLADFIVVTCDSVNMVSEACATGKPVYVVDLPGGSAKFDTFHRRLREAGMTRPFAGPLEPFSYTPPDDVKAAAARIGQMLAARVRQAA